MAWRGRYKDNYILIYIAYWTSVELKHLPERGYFGIVFQLSKKISPETMEVEQFFFYGYRLSEIFANFFPA